jgi:FdhD protein
MWTQHINVLKVSEDRKKKQLDQLVIEKETKLFINTNFVCSLVHTPQFEKELIIGYVFMHYGLCDILDVKYLQESNELHIEAAIHNCHSPSTHLQFSKIDPYTIFQLSGYFQEQAYLYKKTAITESAAIALKDSLLFNAEDISQQNALYKTLGLAYNAGHKSFETLALLVSAKIDSLLMTKLSRLGFLAIISRTAVTKQALDIAISKNISLYGFARGRRFNHYTAL